MGGLGGGKNGGLNELLDFISRWVDGMYGWTSKWVGGWVGGGRRSVPALESMLPPGLICVKVTRRVLLGSVGWGRMMFPAKRISLRTYL